jgi:hypothetical protein
MYTSAKQMNGYSNTYTAFSAFPGASYFLVDGFQLGASVEYSNSKSEQNSIAQERASTYEYNSYGLGTSLHYYFIQLWPIPFIGGSISYTHTESIQTQASLVYSFQAGLSFPISLNMGIEPFVQYSETKGQGYYENYSNTMIYAGIRVAYYVFE